MNCENKHIAGTTVRLSRLKIQLQESRVILLFEGLSSCSNAIKKSFCGPTKVKFRTDVALFQDLNFSCEKVIDKYFCAWSHLWAYVTSTAGLNLSCRLYLKKNAIEKRFEDQGK